jgi:charged multivesicular body protein 6
LSKTDSQLAQLEQLTSDVEFALVQKDVLYGLQQGTAVLKEIHKEMGGIENVEKLLADNEEARAYQEVRHLYLAITMYILTHAQLEALERELNPPVVDMLPDAPKAQPQFTPEEKAQIAKDRAARRARERAAEQASQPMLA